jgi:hypothetical protein
MFPPVATMVATAPPAMITPMATAVIDHGRWSVIARRVRVIARRFVNHGRGCSPAIGIEIDIEVYVGVCGRGCRQSQSKADSAQ